ncbi:hypothetical protein PRUPE_8G124500 [Prunus persica]|uniref:F-box/LRR-repeat protein 15/At3g58940/PEG3-like LRR domain-containing protein n=1 Tax=Prunus persica TaxID=3760 RepID=A0A251MWU7_PRUPE|nr:putative FBD-associated F-box protein At5g56690 [Prunus persica]ONH91582.1 hypothetical protein PRUPE_8G124500 [Prunus persica]
MATKSKAGRKIPNHPKTNKINLKGKQNSKTAATIPHLPVLVILHFLQFLPIKLAIRISSLCKQRAGLWSSIPVLDFDEDEPPHGDENLDIIQLQHTNFINFLDRCLEFHQKCEGLDKFWLRMTLSSVKDKDKVGEWLCFAVGRRVKELDISLKYKYEVNQYCFSSTFLNAKPLVILNLENVTIANSGQPISLPSLQTLSIRRVRLTALSLSALISGCPCIQYLSLTSSSCFESYDLSMQTLLGGKSLTSFNLKYVRVRDDNNNDPKAPIGLPYLKTMSLEIVDLYYPQLISGSPSLEHLSVSFCFAKFYRSPKIPRSSSLKSLEVRDFDSKVVQVSRGSTMGSMWSDDPMAALEMAWRSLVSLGSHGR